MDLNRKVAYKVLLSMEKNGSYSNIELNKIIESDNPPSPSFVRELVYGITENKIYLDYIIDTLVSRGIKSVKIDALILLRMGIYQIGFMNSVPDYAAVNETVSLARKTVRGREGFINGVLRGYLKKRNIIHLPDRSVDEVEYLSIKYSCAPWIVKLWIDQLGVDTCEKILEFSNSVPPMAVRINPLKISKDEFIDKMYWLGFETAQSELVDNVVFIKGSGFLNTEIYKDGYASVQNEESAYAAKMLSPEPGEEVIDMCAAPGGKTCALAEFMENKGNIKSFDVYEHRIDLIRKQAERLGIDIIDVGIQDGSLLNEALIESADKILCDVPCSGLGVIRRKPEIKYKEDVDIDSLCRLQLKILENASKYLRKGGKILYSTCTINRFENQEIVRNFLSKYKDFQLLMERQLLPCTDECDGFYVALMERKKYRRRGLMDVGFRTDKGIRRRANEDACFVMKDEHVFVVADGVGGENSGEVASSTAVKEVANYISNHPLDSLENSEDIRDYFFRCIKDVNFTVLNLSQEIEQNKGMATTLVSAYTAKNFLYILNVGDSRAYICRNGQLTQITEDHTYVNTLIKKGIITVEEAKTHENRHMITRAVGAECRVEPDFFKVGLNVGDIVLICTDGLYGEIEESEIAGIISECKSMQEASDILVNRANENGGHDNITVICIKIMEEDIK